jgi:hypothetical protein
VASLVDTLIVKLLVEGADKLSDTDIALRLLDATQEKVAKSSKKVADAAEGVSVSNEKITKATRTTTTELTKVITAHDKASAAAFAYANRVQQLSRMSEEGTGTEEARAKALELVTAKMQQTIAALDKTTTATQEYSGAVEAAVGHITAYAAEIDRLRAKYSPLTVAAAEFATTMKEVDSALRLGAISQTEHATAVAQTTLAYEKQVVALQSAANDAKAAFTTGMDAQVLAYNKKIEELVPLYDKVGTAAARFAKVQSEVNMLVSAGRLDQEQANKALQEAAAARDKASGQATPTTTADKIFPQEAVNHIKAFNDEVDRLKTKFDPVYAAEQQQLAALKEIGSAFMLNAVSADQWRAEVDKIQASFARAIESINAAKEAQRGLAMPQDQDAQIKAFADEVDRLRLKYVPLVAMEKEHEKEVAAINKAYNVGAIKTQAELQGALTTETQRYDSALKSLSSNLDHSSNQTGKATQTTGQLNAAVTNMGFQLNDIASGLLSGQSPFTILVQQGGQVIQAFAQGGGVGPVLRGVKDAIVGMITPTTLAVTALAALAVGFAVILARAISNTAAIKEFNNALGTVGDNSSTTIKGMEDAALALRNVGVAAADANKFVSDLARNTKINPDYAKEITEVAIATARIRNVDVTQGIKDFQAAMDGSIQTMVDFAFSIHAIDKAEAGNLITMAQEGKGAEAMNRAFRDIRDQAKALAGNTDDSTKAAEKFRSAWNGLLDALSKGSAFKLAQENLTQLAVDLTNLIEKGAIFSAKFMEKHGLSIEGAPLATGNVASSGAPAPGFGTTTPTYGGDYGTLLSGNRATVRPGVVMTPNAPAYIDTMQNVVTQLPPGYGIVITSIGRTKSNSSVGANTAHNPAAGGAFDYKIINTTTGQEYPNVGPDTTPGGLYGQTFQNAAAFIGQKYPALLPFMENGALFGANGGPISATSPPDIGHIGFRGAPTVTGLAANLSGSVAGGGGGPFVSQDPKAVAALDAALAEQNRLLGQSVTVNETLSGPIARARTEAYAAYNQELATSKNEKLAEIAGVNRYNNSLKEQGVAQDTANQKADLAIKGAEGVANAYLDSEQAGIKAAAAEQARVDVMEHGGDVAQQTQRILNQQATEALTASAKAIPGLQLQTKETERLAEATKGGAAAQHDMELQNQATSATHDVVAKAEATGNAAYIAEAKNLEAVTLALIKKNDAAQTSVEIAKQINANKDQIDIDKVEAQYAFQTTEEIQRQVALLQTKQFLLSKGKDLNSAESQALLKNVDSLQEANIALAEQQRSAQRLNDVLVGVGQTIDQAITQNVSNALSGKKITAWHTIFKDALVQLESQLISMSVIKPAIGSLLGMLNFGGAASNFGTFGGGGGASLLSGIFGGSLGGGGQGTSGATGAPITLEQRDKEGNLTGTLSTVSSVGSLANTGSGLFGGGGSGGIFGGLGNFLNNNVGTSLGFAPTGLTQGTGAGAGIFSNAAGVTSDVAGGGVASGLFGGTTLTSALGGIGAGATVGSLANMFIGPMIGGGKSTGGMIGSTGGAIAGTLLGSLIGMPFLGGLIGGSAGGLLGGFFGPKPANNAGSGSLNLATGQLGAFTSGGVAANDQAAQGILQPISTTLANITQILGASVLPQATLIAQAGSRDGIKVNIASGEGVKSFTGSDAGAVVQEVAQFLFEHRDLSALSPTLQKAVGSLDINQIQDTTQLTTAVNFSKIYDTIVTAADSAFQSIESGAQQAGPFEQAMSQITDTFAQLTTQAQQYGLSIDPINAALAEATKRINVDFAKAVDAAYNTATGNDFLNGVQSLVDNYASMAREASAIGASTTVFDKLGQTFDASLKTMFAQLNSTQLNAVIAAFGDLGNDLPALAASARDAALASEALIAAQNQQAQIYQNQQDSYTAANQGFLAQLRDLDKARIATQATNKSLGLGPDQDAQVQETEHRAALNILMALTNDQMESARAVLAQLNPAFAAWVDEAEAAVKATNDGADASARAAKVLQDQANIQAYLNQLQTQSSVFTSGKSRLDAAQSQYNTTLAAAQGGDETALSQITTAAQTLLTNVSDYYASSAPGQAIFKQVQDQLTALLGTGLTQTQDKTTTDVVNAITDDTATTTNVSNANSLSLINAGIDAAKQITDNAISTTQGVISAAKSANDNIVATTISTSVDMTNATLNGAATIVGGTATQFVAQTATLMTGTGTIVDATGVTTAAVISTGSDLAAGTQAVLDNNVANSASLISANSNNAIATINNNVANAAALQTASAANAKAIMDGNTADAATITQRTTDTTNSLMAANENHTAILTATAQSTSDHAVASATSNTQAIVAQADLGTQQSIATYNAAAAGIVNTTAAKSDALLNQTVATGNAAQATANANTANLAAKADQQLSAAQTTSDTVAAAASWIVGTINSGFNWLVPTNAAWAANIYNQIAAWTQAEINTINAAVNWLGGFLNDQNNNQIATIANWSNAIIQSQVAWDNAINGTLSTWLSGLYGVSAGSSNGIVQAVFASADSINGSAWNNANWEVATIWASANSIIGSAASDANVIVGAVYGSASSVIGSVTAYENATRASVDSTNQNLAGWLNNVYNAVNGANNNDVSWNQNLYNKLQEILNNMIGWMNNLYGELHLTREYINLLTEVTIQFDEWMAGASGAQLDAMNNIQNTLRRQAFG